jgi:peptidoglycan/xylan/chitin deacetylase (PgdA/CDA1 family)
MCCSRGNFYSYTPNLMEFLAQNNLKATIFAVGSRVLYNPRLLQQQYMAGHQIAVHTW